MNILVTGGAGFIGSHLTEYLLSLGHRVTVFDDLSTGRTENLSAVIKHPNLVFVKGDICKAESITPVLEGQELVFHMCDNSDIRFAAEHPQTYLDQNIYGLFHLMQAMRQHNVKKLIFPSSTTVLGDAKTIPAPETYGPLVPMNIYGGAKMACEGLISAWAHTFDIQAWIFRFVGIIGGRMDHGVVFDFVKKLNTNPESLEILGDGSQKRSFIIVNDCVEAMWKSFNELKDEQARVIHIGNVDQISINEVAKIITTELGFNKVQFSYSGGKVGWKGDAASNFIGTETLDKLSWKPKLTSAAAVAEAAKRIQKGSFTKGVTP